LDKFEEDININKNINLDLDYVVEENKMMDEIVKNVIVEIILNIEFEKDEIVKII
jgi:hypothetical protein